MRIISQDEREGERSGGVGMDMYVYTTSDRYELPLAVCDSTKELAEVLGVRHTTVSCVVSRSKKQRKNRYHKVPFEPAGKKFSGRIVRELRKKNALAADELADAMKVSANCVLAWERGYHEPSVATVFKLAEFFETDTDTFFE